MDRENKIYLLLIEADKIQSYIFQTGKLKENIGASALIDEYNKSKVYTCLYNNGYEGNINKNGDYYKITNESIISNNLEYELIYSAGGNVKILVRSADKALEIAKKLAELYRKSTITGDVSWVIHEFNANNSFDTVIKEAEMKLRSKKLSKNRTVQPLTIPHLKLCSSCGKEPALELPQVASEEEYLCSSCHRKREQGQKNEQELFVSFFRLLTGNLKQLFSEFQVEEKTKFAKATFCFDNYLPKQFDHLADDRGFIAVALIDGNRYGKKIERFIKEACAQGGNLQEAVAKLRKFSLTLNSIAEESLGEAVAESFKNDLAKDKKIFESRFIKEEEDSNGFKQRQFFLPFRPIIIGGDDLTFVCSPDKVFDISLKFAHNIRQKSAKLKDLFGKKGLSCSIGIAIVKSHFPFKNAHQLAEELVAKAKQSNREHLHKDGRDFSAIDFSVVNTSSVDELDNLRKKEYSYTSIDGDCYRLTNRPYIIVGEEDAKTNNEEEVNRKDFITLIENTNKLQRCLAANKFKSLRQILRTGKTNSNYKWLAITTRLKADQRKEAEEVKEFYGGLWRKETYAHRQVYINNFIDMVEISPYLGNL